MHELPKEFKDILPSIEILASGLEQKMQLKKDKKINKENETILCD